MFATVAERLTQIAAAHCAAAAGRGPAGRDWRHWHRPLLRDRRLARERVRFLETFLAQLAQELSGR